jgi:Tfp pilus assembly protein PilE
VRAAAREGFSRAELVFLLGVCLVLVSIALPAQEYYRRWQRNLMTRADLRSIVAAATRFHTQTGAWPARSAAGVDGQFGTRVLGNAAVFNVLRAVDGAGNEGHATNTNRTRHLDVAAASEGFSGIDARGEFLDPWGSPYRVVLDLDFDGICDAANTSYGRVQGRGIIAWSPGPDRRSDTEDDLLSWTDRRSAGARTLP